ncbi:MAG: hypothetical protein M3328_17965 [Chloroflexota bacterium]|nr:hypothetical protein [Chloroflexota bacterium]
MDNTYGEFQGTELDPSLDFDTEEDEQDDLIPILGLAAFVAAIVGAILVLLGRRRKPTPQERIEQVLSVAGKEGKKRARTVAKAAQETNLGDLLDEARKRAGKVTSDIDIADVISDVRKRAERATRDADLGSLLDEARHKVRQAAKRVDLGDVADTARDASKRAAKAVSNARDVDIDTGGAANLLDTLKARLADTVDSVRKDLAPTAGDKLKSGVVPVVQAAAETVTRKVKEDVVPAAQDLAGKLREDVIPAAQQRAEKLAGDSEVSPRARKAASAAMGGAATFGDMLRGLAMAGLERMIEDVLPGARKVGGSAVRTAREDVIPAAAQTAGEAAQRVREDVLPRVGEVAAQTPDVLGEILRMARERVEDAIDKAQPAASDAFTFTRHRAGSVASVARDGSRGVGGTLSSARRGVSDAVGGAVHATTYATRETAGTLFWLTVLGGLITVVFVPEREKQQEVYNNVLQFLGEVREMWRDLQGPDYDPATTGNNGTA